MADPFAGGPAEALRPLWQDLARLGLPLMAACAVGALGLGFRRLPRWGRVVMACAAALAFLVPLAGAVGWVPGAIHDRTGRIVAWLGGVTTVEAFVAAHLLCIVWSAPKRSLSSPFLATLLAAVAAVVVVDNVAALRWRLRHADPGDIVWSNRCSPEGILAQRTGTTCAPASAAMLLHRHGVEVSEGAMAYRAGTSAFGTDEYELADGITSVLSDAGGPGGRADATHESVDDVLAGEVPCIVYIDTPFGCHAVLLDRVAGERVAIVDPLGGIRKELGRGDFAAAFRGVVVRVTTGPR